MRLRSIKKRGDEKYYIIISLILGLMVLAISLYWIFQEYFNKDQIDWETCRNSVLLRSGNLPNFVKLVQEEAPLKCKTQVVTINFRDYDKAGKLIMDTMAQCWYLFGEGKLQLYSSKFLGSSSKCFECARIHFNEDVRDYYSPAVNNINNLQEVKPIWNRLNQIIGLTNDLGPRPDLQEGLKKAQEEVEAKKSTVTSDELARLNLAVDAAQKKLNEYDALIKEQNSLGQQYDQFLIKYRDVVGTGGYSFNWVNFLTTEYVDGKSYGQYFYPNFPNWRNEALDAWEPFKDYSFSNGLVYDKYFDARKGDLIVTVLFNTGAVNFILWEKGAYNTIVPHQTSQQLKCTIESIPA